MGTIPIPNPKTSSYQLRQNSTPPECPQPLKAFTLTDVQAMPRSLHLHGNQPFKHYLLQPLEYGHFQQKNIPSLHSTINLNRSDGVPYGHIWPPSAKPQTQSRTRPRRYESNMFQIHLAQIQLLMENERARKKYADMHAPVC